MKDGTYLLNGEPAKLSKGYQVAYNNYLSPKKIIELAKYSTNGIMYIGVYKSKKEISINILSKYKAVELAHEWKQYSI